MPKITVKKPKVKKCSCAITWNVPNVDKRIIGTINKIDPSCEIHGEFACICTWNPQTFDRKLNKQCPRYKTAMKAAVEHVGLSH